MDKQLFDDILDIVEKVNPDIAEGLAVKELNKVELYMDKVWRSAADSFPPNLFYDGYERYKPEEENNLLLKRYDSKSYYELAQTDTFIVKYKFIYKDPYSGTDKRFHCDIRLPFVGKGGKMKIMGIGYTAMPIAADPVFSASKNDLFVSLNKRNEKFYRFTYNFECNDIKNSATVVWANMLPGSSRKKKNTKRTATTMYLNNNRRKTKVDCCPIALYLFSRYGLTKTFEKFGAEVKLVTKEEANELNRAEWKICNSVAKTNKNVKDINPKGVHSSNLALAIKTGDFNIDLKCLVAAFFYIADYYPDNIYPEFVDEERQWLIILGHIIFSDEKFSEGLIIQRISSHLASLDGYIDIVTKENLEEVGVKIDTIYDLFIYIIKNIQSVLLNANPVTMYNKKIMVLPYILKDVIASINTFTFHLNRIKPNNLSYTTIYDALRTNVKMDRVIQGPDKARGTVLVTSSCDTLIYEHTAKVILQSQITDKKNSNAQGNIEEKNIDISVAEVCSYGNHSKREPTGRGMLNLFVKIKPNGMIERSERLFPLLAQVDHGLKKT